MPIAVVLVLMTVIFLRPDCRAAKSAPLYVPLMVEQMQSTMIGSSAGISENSFRKSPVLGWLVGTDFFVASE